MNLEKEYGEGSIITGDQLKEYSNDIVRWSPKLDAILGGGVPGGSVVTLAGAPKSGKSLSALHLAMKAQKHGRPIYYFNIEGRIKPRDLVGIKGLDLSKVNIIRSHRNEDGTSRILTAEEYLDIAEKVINEVPKAVVILDSISQLTSSKEFTKDMGEASRAPGAVLMAQLCRKVCNVVPVNDIILIGILHIVANTSGWGKPTSVTGGNKIRYAMDIGLECKKFTYIREGGGEDTDGESLKKAIGQKVQWITTSTAFGPPGQMCESIIKYGIGIDEITELVQIGIELGLVTKGGAWYSLSYMQTEGGKEVKVQGEAKLVDLISANANGELDKLEKQIGELMGYNES